MKIGDTVELTEEIAACFSYWEYADNRRMFPIGTRFVIVPTADGRIGLRLLVDGKPIRQTGHTDGAFVGVPPSSYRLESKLLKLKRMVRDL